MCVWWVESVGKIRIECILEVVLFIRAITCGMI